MGSRIAVYPGSFDPMTLGHQNLVERALHVFDEVVLAVLVHPDKRALFSAEERVDLIGRVFTGNPRVSVDSFQGLLVDFMRRRGARTVLRGLRAVQDFEYEFQMTMMNRRMAPSVDTVYLMTDEQFFYIASRTVKEVASLGGDIRGLVPEVVREAMARKLGSGGDGGGGP
jgi:pantetheine-phosphate adenylyltransferase